MRPQHMTTIHVHLSDPTADTAVLELLTQQLRRLLLTVNTDPAWRHTDGDLRRHPLVDLVDTGAMQITMIPSRAQLSRLVNTIRMWVTREDRVAVTLRVDDARLTILGAASPDRAHRVDAWVQRALSGTPYDDTWVR